VFEVKTLQAERVKAVQLGLALSLAGEEIVIELMTFSVRAVCFFFFILREE
jgi:hypothetical protein